MILRADARRIPLADESVQMVCTSPPYWSLRDYLVAGQIGLEKSIAEYIATMVAVFDEVKRVLRRDGVCFVNIGDSYASGEIGRHDYGAFIYREKAKGIARQQSRCSRQTKPKDLCLIPERLAIALQERGWYVRSRVAWIKPAPMPESVTDRPTSAWEHIWMLTKSSSYFYDAEAVRESALADNREFFRGRDKYTNSNSFTNGAAKTPQGRGHVEGTGSRNLRNWWQIGPDPSSEAYCVTCDLMYDHSPQGGVCVRCKGKLTAHYAAFPRELVRKCILAGTPEKGSCAECGTPWVRVVDKKYLSTIQTKVGDVETNEARFGQGRNRNVTRMGDGVDVTTLGWQPQCKCNAPTRPALCFDPFMGTGTTALVAESLGRRWLGTELSWDYCRYARRRLSQPGLFGGFAVAADA